ncbi:uncharacterized protein LOC135431381 [Drosophila montana]|uniref:uncharacterized protein LOC135431381 n=1 Tax=Drosophila montana TaxID=40370 RepID=UPI00313E847A
MHNLKFQVLTKFQARIFNIPPKCRSICLNRYLHKDYKYVAGDADSCVDLQRKDVNRQTGRSRVLFGSRSMAAFKNRMSSCTDPVKKYEYLAELRDSNLDLYYRYMCDNTTEVLSIISSVDGIVDDFCRMATMILNNVKTQRDDLTPKQLDVLNTMHYLRKHLNYQKKDTLPKPVESTCKPANVYASPAFRGQSVKRKPIQNFNKALMLTPDHFYVLYMNFGRRTKKV